MPIVKRSLALAVSLLLLMMTAAQAEISFLVHTDAWDMENTPVEVLLKAEVDTHMPFDDDRLAMLTPVTDLLSLRIVTGQNEGCVTVAVAENDALSVQYRGSEVRLSSMPGIAYTAQGDPLSTLLGSDIGTGSLYEALSLSPQGEALLTDGRALMAKFPAACETYGQRTKTNTAITGCGQSAYRLDFAFTKDQVAVFKESLLANCPAGWLREIIESLTFEGKQTVRMYFTAADALLRMEYNGNCGPADDLRTTKLVYRLRHDDEVARDDIQLTSPAIRSKNRNTLTFVRTIQTNKNGQRTLSGNYAYTVIADGVKSEWEGKFDLNNAFTDQADVLTGEIYFKTRINGAGKYDELTLQPALTFSGTKAAPMITGSLEVSQKYAGQVTEHAIVKADIQRATPLIWSEPSKTIDLSAMDKDALAAAQQDVAASIATALVRPLIVAMGADAQWFFRDLPQEAVQSILDATAAQQP